MNISISEQRYKFLEERFSDIICSNAKEEFKAFQKDMLKNSKKEIFNNCITSAVYIAISEYFETVEPNLFNMAQLICLAKDELLINRLYEFYINNYSSVTYTNAGAVETLILKYLEMELKQDTISLSEC